MKIIIFGLTVSSSWGNGHATLWRGLIRALARRNCDIVFYERDTPYYALNRDLTDIPGAELVLYADWSDVAHRARSDLAAADVGLVTSYCPDAVRAAERLHAAGRPLSVFYDLDTPVTLARITAAQPVDYLGPHGLRDFDLVLSFTGGRALEELQRRLGARMTAPLYGHVDPSTHRPAPMQPHYVSDLSYLGTYSSDRQNALQRLLLDPAISLPARRFMIGGAQYPQEFPWCPNLHFVRHLPPSEHAAFFCSSRLTLNVTREPMRQMGWCPSGRVFEAAACGTAVISDDWMGLGDFYTEGSEVLIARSAEDVVQAIELSDSELKRIARAASDRTMAQHTSAHRADEFLKLVGATRSCREPELLAKGA